MKNKTLITSILVAVVLIGLAVWLTLAPEGPGKLDGFAKCLNEKGAKFYGAFWCSHCRNQKALFGKSVKYLPYIECSNPDGNSQNQLCNDKKIEGYPTWEFSDGSRLNGEISLETLASTTKCALPQ